MNFPEWVVTVWEWIGDHPRWAIGCVLGVLVGIANAAVLAARMKGLDQ
jgi:hypothetical protein